MKQSLTAFAWRCLDPALRRIGSRLDHLGALTPPVDRAALDRILIAPTSTEIERGAEFVNQAPRNHLTIGEYCWIRGILSVTTPRGRLAIGHHVVIGQHTRIWAALDVRVGHYVKIAHNVDIHDNDSHPIDAALRREDAIAYCERRASPDMRRIASAPVRIEDDAWICFKASILKGVTIGTGAIVAAGAVVTKDVAPFTLVAGNPARFVKRVDGDVRLAIAASDEALQQRRSG